MADLKDNLETNWQKMKETASDLISDAAFKTRDQVRKVINPSKGSRIGLEVRRIAIYFIILLLFYLLVALLFAKSAYKVDSESKSVRFVENIVPYPAAIVGRRVVPLARVKSDIQVINFFIKATKTEDRYKDIDIEQNLYERAIEMALIEKVAEDYAVVVSDAEVESAWEAILKEEDGYGDVDIILKEFHNTSDKSLKRFIRDKLLRDKVDSEIPKRRYLRHIVVGFQADDANSKAKAFERINEIRNHIVAGTKFEDVAREHSEDVKSRDSGGDIGWVDVDFRVEGQIEPALTKAVFETPLNTVSLPVETRLGYELVMPIEEKGKVAKSTSQLIEEQRQKTKIIRFLKF